MKNYKLCRYSEASITLTNDSRSQNACVGGYLNMGNDQF